MQHTKVEHYTKCVVERVEHHDNGTVEAFFRFPHALTIGETHSFSYRIIPDGNPIEAESHILYWAKSDNINMRTVIQAQFDPLLIPTTIWRVDAIPPLRAPGSPETCPTVEADLFGFVELEFTRRVPGYGYGLGWKWPSGS